MSNASRFKREFISRKDDEADSQSTANVTEQPSIDDDDDYVEEEMLLFADFEKHLADEELAGPNVRIKVIGMDSETPIIQINNDVYKGSFDFALGTNVFFEQDPEGKAKIDPLYSLCPEKVYKYAGQSDKVLKMKRIFINPKDAGSIKPEEDDYNKQDVKYIVNRTYQDALNLHLPENTPPPRHIEPSNNCNVIVGKIGIKPEPETIPIKQQAPEEFICKPDIH